MQAPSECFIEETRSRRDDKGERAREKEQLAIEEAALLEAQKSAKSRKDQARKAVRARRKNLRSTRQCWVGETGSTSGPLSGADQYPRKRRMEIDAEIKKIVKQIAALKEIPKAMKLDATDKLDAKKIKAAEKLQTGNLKRAKSKPAKKGKT